MGKNSTATFQIRTFSNQSETLIEWNVQVVGDLWWDVSNQCATNADCRLADIADIVVKYLDGFSNPKLKIF